MLMAGEGRGLEIALALEHLHYKNLQKRVSKATDP